MARVIFEFNTESEKFSKGDSQEDLVKGIVKSDVVLDLGLDEKQSPAAFMAKALYHFKEDVIDLLKRKISEMPGSSIKKVERSSVVDIPESERTVH